ncbi:hypothetical protein L6241_10315 [Janibacter sp. Y6]|uniref:hypothetical protein n=1 Tax=Janibacter sp. Y6 TaxID=2913552 RepID=UPI0034A5B048
MISAELVCALSLLVLPGCCASDEDDRPVPPDVDVTAALPVGTDVDCQLGGPSAPSENVGIVVRDRHDQPSRGRYNVFTSP